MSDVIFDPEDRGKIKTRKPTTGRLFCRCLYEIENGLERTQHCFMPCIDQQMIMEERRRRDIEANTHTPTLELFTELIGKVIKVYYIHIFDHTCQRTGRLEMKDGWAYLYDEGKSGQEYNGAFHIKDPEQLEGIIGIEIVE